VDRLYNKVDLNSIMPTTEDKRDEFSEVENCINLHQLQVNDSSENSQIKIVSIKAKLDGLEKSFNCTKNLLAAASPYFKAMFRGGFKEAHSKEVIIQADPDVFSEILSFIKKKELEINEKNVEKLMVAASMFQISDLMKLSSEFLESQIEVDNCIGFATFTKNYGYDELSTKFNNFIGKNFIKISQSEEFKLQPESVISELISKDDLHVVCESQVFNAVVEWVRYDVNSRRHSLDKLIKNVRCHLIKPEFISRQLENCEIVRSTCYDYLTKVLEDLNAFIPIECKSRQLVIPQVIYTIQCVHERFCENLLESAEFYLFEKNVSFKIPKLVQKLIAPFDRPRLQSSRCAVINGFIYVLNPFNGDMNRYNPISNEWKKCKSLIRVSLDIKIFLPKMVSIQNEIYVIEGRDENILMK